MVPVSPLVVTKGSRSSVERGYPFRYPRWAEATQPGRCSGPRFEIRILKHPPLAHSIRSVPNDVGKDLAETRKVVL